MFDHVNLSLRELFRSYTVRPAVVRAAVDLAIEAPAVVVGAVATFQLVEGIFVEVHGFLVEVGLRQTLLHHLSELFVFHERIF